MKLGIMGFCWGTWVVFHAGASGNFSAAVGAHPSHIMIGSMYGSCVGNVPIALNSYRYIYMYVFIYLLITGILGDGTPVSQAEAIKCPVLMLPAGGDQPDYKQGGEVHFFPFYPTNICP